MQLQNNDIIKKGQGVVPAGRISAKKKLRGGIKKPAFQARQFPSSPRQNSPARRPVPTFHPSPASGRGVPEDSKEEENEDEKEEQSQTSQGQSAMPEQLQRKEQPQPKQQLNSDAEQQDAGAEMRAQQNEQRRQSQSSPAESLSGENSISENPSLPEMPARQNAAGEQAGEEGSDEGKKDNFRSVQFESRRKKEKEESEMLEKEEKMSGIKLTSAWLLQTAKGDVLATLGFGTFGLSVLYIDLHLFLLALGLNNLVCSLGEENLLSNVLNELKTEEDGSGKKWAKLKDIILFSLTNFIWLMIVLSIGVLVIMITSWMGESWWGKIWNIGKLIYKLGWEGVSAVVNLFNV